MSKYKTLLLEYELDSLYKNVNVSNQLGYTRPCQDDMPANFAGYTGANFMQYKDPNKGYPTLLFSVVEHMVNMPENMVDLNAELGLSFQVSNTVYNTGLVDAHVSQRVHRYNPGAQEYGVKLVIRQIPFDWTLESIRVSGEKYMSLVDYIVYKFPNIEEIEFNQTNIEPHYASDFLCRVLLNLKQEGISLDLSKAASSDFAMFFDRVSMYGGVKEFGVKRLTITDVQLFSVLYQSDRPWFEGISDLRVIGINEFKMSHPFLVKLTVGSLTLDVSNCQGIHRTFYKYLTAIKSDLMVLSLMVAGGQMTPASAEILTYVYSGQRDGLYAFKDIRIILGFKSNGGTSISLSELASPEILSRIVFLKIYDDMLDIYKDRSNRYTIHMNGAQTCIITSPADFNVLAHCSMLNNHAALTIYSGINIVLVNNLGYSVDYSHLFEK